jgi:hypothetical protein
LGATRESLDPQQLNLLLNKALQDPEPNEDPLASLQLVLWSLGKFGFQWSELAVNQPAVYERVTALVRRSQDQRQRDLLIANNTQQADTDRAAGSRRAYFPERRYGNSKVLRLRVAAGMLQSLGLLRLSYDEMEPALRDLLNGSIEEGLVASMSSSANVFAVVAGYARVNATFAGLSPKLQGLMLDLLGRASPLAKPSELAACMANLCRGMQVKVSELPEDLQKCIAASLQSSLHRWPNR